MEISKTSNKDRYSRWNITVDLRFNSNRQKVYELVVVRTWPSVSYLANVMRGRDCPKRKRT